MLGDVLIAHEKDQHTDQHRTNAEEIVQELGKVEAHITHIEIKEASQRNQPRRHAGQPQKLIAASRIGRGCIGTLGSLSFPAAGAISFPRQFITSFPLDSEIDFT